MRWILRGLVAVGLTLGVALPAHQGAGAATTGNPVQLTSGFYVDPNSNPAAWVQNNPNDGRRTAIQNSIASKPMARWFGNWSNPIGTSVGSFVGAADAADKLPVLVAYNIPGRDACGGHSGGGAGTPAAYRAWIHDFAVAIGNRPAVVVIEPDSLGDFNCMNADQIAERNGMLTYAVQQFKDLAPNAWAYLDGGSSRLGRRRRDGAAAQRRLPGERARLRAQRLELLHHRADRELRQRGQQPPVSSEAVRRRHQPERQRHG